MKKPPKLLYRYDLNKRVCKREVPDGWGIEPIEEYEWGVLWMAKQDPKYGPSPSFYGYQKLKEAVIEEYFNSRERMAKEKAWLDELRERVKKFDKIHGRAIIKYNALKNKEKQSE